MSRAKYVIISVGTNDVDHEKPDAVALNIIKCAEELKSKNNQCEIFINQLPPRKLRFIEETKQVNEILSSQVPDSIHLIEQSDIQLQHLKDDKHIRQDSIK